MEKMNDFLKSSRSLGMAIIYSALEIVIRLQGQLNIHTGLANQNDDLTLRWQLTSSVSTIFASTISVLARYLFQTYNRASRVICIQVFNKNILIQLL